MNERAQIALQAVVVIAVLGVAAYGIASSTSEPPPIAQVTLQPEPDASLIDSTLRTRTPAPTATLGGPSPSPSPAIVTLPPSPSPTPTPRAPALRAYSYGGRAYTGVELGTGWTVVAPFDGRLEIIVYQILDGDFRADTDVPGVPKYPYFHVTAADGRRFTFRPGALGVDSAALREAGQVREGEPLFLVRGDGRSSWAFRYDGDVPFQIVTSLVDGAGSDLDAAPLFDVR